MPRALLVVAFAAALVPLSPRAARAQAVPTPSIETLKASVESTARAGDGLGLERALEAIWPVDRVAARDAAYWLVTHPNTTLGPIGADALGRHATAAELDQAARSLDATRHPDTRRWLVRAMGRRPASEAFDLLAGYLRDSDRQVQLAAIAALAELKDARALPLLRDRLSPQPPSASPDMAGESDAVDLARWGAVAAITGVRPRAGTPGEPRGDPAPAVDPAKAEWTQARRGGSVYFEGPSFDVSLRFEGLRTPADADAMLRQPLMALTETSARSALRSVEGTFGRVALPPVRLYLADEAQFPGLAKVPTSFGGSARGNEIVIQFGPAFRTAPVLTHEYVHVAQYATFPGLPRWLSEGTAESFTFPGGKSGWTAARVRAMGLERDLRDGVVSDVVAWGAGAVTGPREAALYGKSYLVVEFLRYGGFAAPEARLAALMARAAKGQPARNVLESLYGPVRRLDDDLRRWIDSRPAAAVPGAAPASP